MSWASPVSWPDYRVTFSDGELVFSPWRPSLIGGYGPGNQLLSRLGRSVAMADLTILGPVGDKREAIITELTASASKAFRETLSAWASTLGYRRLWWRDDVIELDGWSGLGGRSAWTRCRTCGSVWADQTQDFWATSADAGLFPLWCPACGGAVPQWRLDPASPHDASDRAERALTTTPTVGEDHDE